MVAPRPLPPIDDLRRALAYDPATGIITWNHRADNPAWNSRYGGKPAGCLGENGYLQIRFAGLGHRYHRIAWALHHDEDPGQRLIDHADRDPLNNRIDNLRLATTSQNQQNMKRVGRKWPKGVKLDRARGKFKALIRTGGRRIESPRFDTPEEAHEAYKRMAVEHHGKFARFE
jgi:hypothetical protein